jgi:hypothetical protein
MVATSENKKSFTKFQKKRFNAILHTNILPLNGTRCVRKLNELVTRINSDFTYLLKTINEQKIIKNFEFIDNTRTYYYSFNNPLCLTTVKETNLYVCSLLVLPDIEGKGKTETKAFDDWRESFHLNFQKISGKRHWERTKEEYNLRKTLEKIIDIESFWSNRPLEIRQTGKFVEDNNLLTNERKILWLDGTHNIINLDDCPSEFANYEIEKYWIATLQVNRETGQLLKIIAVEPTNYKDYSNQEIKEFIESLPTSKDLPISKIWK